MRARLGAVSDPERPRALAERVIGEARAVKNHPPDVINVALEVLVRESLELPGFSTLNEIAALLRGQFGGVRRELCEDVPARVAADYQTA